MCYAEPVIQSKALSIPHVFVKWAGQVRESGEQLRTDVKAVLRPQCHMEDNLNQSVGK
jgi:hypothetical protein